MKRFAFLGCIAAALLSFVACEETGKETYEGTNYIYLSSEAGKTTILESDQTPLPVEVMLTTALSEDLSLTFAVKGTEGVVELQNNPVTIKAGEKTATFEIVSLNAGILTEAANFTVALDPAAALPAGVELKSEFAFVVNPAPVQSDLTPEQLAIIEDYKAATGIDLSKYIGEVNVSVEYTGFDNENEVPLDPVTFTGKTVITLSESATAELPVLKMLNNPMGIQDKMEATLRAMTVENADWCDAEYYPDNAGLMAAINWNAESQEVFSMSLDGISFNADKTVDFLGTGLDQYGDEIVIVPFEYSFTAYDRELVAIEDGTFVKVEEYAFDCTANPAYHMNNTGIDEDYCEYGNYVEASAEVSAEALTFTFCIYMCVNDYDYTKVVATYTPNN